MYTARLNTQLEINDDLVSIYVEVTFNNDLECQSIEYIDGPFQDLSDSVLEDVARFIETQQQEELATAKWEWDNAPKNWKQNEMGYYD